MQSPNCGIGTDRPVRLALLAWAGIGLALTTYGLYDISTYRCPPGADCGGPLGFVLVLWGLAVVGLVTVVVLGQFVARRLRSDAER